MEATVINRLTGLPYGADSADNGLNERLLRTDPWTVEEVQETALALGKEFRPDEETLACLTRDLPQGAFPVFTGQEMDAMIDKGRIPKGMRKDILSLVEGEDDIAIIVPSAIKEWEARQRAQSLLLRRSEGERWWH